jgi:hypothetical protein
MMAPTALPKWASSVATVVTCFTHSGLYAVPVIMRCCSDVGGLGRLGFLTAEFDASNSRPLFEQQQLGMRRMRNAAAH